jgi:carbonic anhydrase
MYKFKILITLLCVANMLTACMSKEPEVEIKDRVLSQAERAVMTPDDVLAYLKQGNQRFVAGILTKRDHSSQVRDAVDGQYPKALVLSCLDSRIPVEDVFDLGIGDLFVARVAGNFENTDILGSMEFAGIHDNGNGVKLIVVMGHGSCGAIKHALDDTKAGNITAMLTNIKPAIETFSSYTGEQTSNNSEFVKLVTDKNVEITTHDIRERSAILKELENQGKIKIIGANYDMHTGFVTFFE